MRFVAGVSLGMLLMSGPAAAPVRAQSTPAKPESPSAAPLRIAFVNAPALLKGMPGYAQAESTWKAEAQAADSQARRIRAVFDSAVATYQQSQAMMTPSNRSAREKQLQAQADSVEAKLQGLQNQIGQREQELLAPMQDRLRAIIDGMRAEAGYAMIIDLAQFSGALVSYDKSLDITLRVAQRLAGQSP